MTVVAVIPARFDATRLPGKPLADLAGKPLIAHVVARALEARLVDRVVVATDHDGIAQAARAAGAEAVMTASELPSGSDRMGAALAGVDFELAVNLQGDEPELDPVAIDRIIDAMRRHPQVAIGTLSAPLLKGDLGDLNCVKVVCDRSGMALYFSRAPVGADREDLANQASAPRSAARRHVGLYVYRPEALAQFLALEPSPLERLERLEQLRALEHGMRILVVPLDVAPRGIDTPEDLAAARRRVLEQA